MPGTNDKPDYTVYLTPPPYPPLPINFPENFQKGFDHTFLFLFLPEIMKRKRAIVVEEQEAGGCILGAYLRQKRKEKNWTIAVLAEKAGVDDKHLGKVERGISSQPSFEYICKLADALEIKPDDIWQELKRKSKNP